MQSNLVITSMSVISS